MEGKMRRVEGVWRHTGERALGKCEVCMKYAWIIECVEGKWKGVRVAACSRDHAVKAIRAFSRQKGGFVVIW